MSFIARQESHSVDARGSWRSELEMLRAEDLLITRAFQDSRLHGATISRDVVSPFAMPQGFEPTPIN